MTDEDKVRALIERFETAIHDKDAAAAIACYAPDAVAFDLAPPLVQGRAALHDPAGLEAWFKTWTGPIRSVAHEVTIRVGGEIAYTFALRRMTGTKTDGEAIDLWFRSTAAYTKAGGDWRIAHIHESVPFAMDGSGKALLDLKP